MIEINLQTKITMVLQTVLTKIVECLLKTSNPLMSLLSLNGHTNLIVIGSRGNETPRCSQCDPSRILPVRVSGLPRLRHMLSTANLILS